MEDKILELISNYSVNGKKADKGFIEQLVNIVVNYKELNNYIENLYFYENYIDENAKVVRVAEYNFIDKYMSSNITAINMFIDSYMTYFGSKFNDLEQLFYGNLLVSQIVLHELEHTVQNKKYHSSVNNTETTLIKMGLSTSFLLEEPTAFLIRLENQGYTPEEIDQLLRQQVGLYKKYYKYNPIERLADINAYNTLFKVLGPMHKELPNLYDYEYCNYLKSLLSGYDVNCDDNLVSPTAIYMNGMNYQQKLPEFKFYDEDPKIMRDKIFQQHSFIERLSYGLPVNKIEYDMVDKQLVKCNKF